jgi:hypothetical protein
MLVMRPTVLFLLVVVSILVGSLLILFALPAMWGVLTKLGLLVPGTSVTPFSAGGELEYDCDRGEVRPVEIDEGPLRADGSSVGGES